MNDFYTYAYLRLEDSETAKAGTPYYIGKGRLGRAYKSKRNGVKPPKDISRILILKKNLSEEEAFKHEIYMINVLGRKDLGSGILHNRTNGGEGLTGHRKSAKSKLKLIETIENYSLEKRSSISAKHSASCKNRSISERQKVSANRREAALIREKNLTPEQKAIKAAKVAAANIGKKRFVNSEGVIVLRRDCPGPDWQRGTKWKPKVSQI